MGVTTMDEIIKATAEAGMDEAIAAAFVAGRRKLDVEHHDRLDSALKIVSDRGVTLEDDGTATVKGHDAEYYIVTRDGCNCKDATVGKAPKGLCKHRLAVILEQGARNKLRVFAEAASAPLAAASTTIPSAFVVNMRGKDFVTFAGLLAMAHDKGLMSLEADFVSVSAELATAKAKAMFADGRCFSESADATPENVGGMVRPHFARMALTRAKARCLRDALNIGMVAIEELGDHADDLPRNGVKRPPYVPEAAENFVDYRKR